MGRFFRAALFGSVLALGAGCSDQHGFLGTDYNPNGDITVTNSLTHQVLTTSATAPFAVTTGAFPVGIAETNFNGPYVITMTKWNDGFNVPCFIPHQTDATGHVNIWTFTSDNANPPTDPVSQPNPCVFGDGDVETALIDDTKGNSAYFYFALVASPTTNAASRLPFGSGAR